MIILMTGHASLVEPPSRAAMHLYGFPQNPVRHIYSLDKDKDTGKDKDIDIDIDKDTSAIWDSSKPLLSCPVSILNGVLTHFPD